MVGSRALVLRAFAHSGVDGWPPTGAPETRLRLLVDEVTRLDLEVETLSAALAEFSSQSDRALSEALEELGAAEGLATHLRVLEDGLRAVLEALERGEPLPRPGPSARRRRRANRRAARARRGAPRTPLATDTGLSQIPAGARPAEPAAALATESASLTLKRLYRRLARLLHPDLAEDGERERLGELMVRANTAYATGDLAALTLLAERVGMGEPPADAAPEERWAYLEHRIETLSRIARSLARERDQLLRSDTHRLWQEARRREDEGGDYLEETRQEILEEAEAAYGEVMFRLERLNRVAAELSTAKARAMTNILKSGPTGIQRAFDPLRETDIVRLAAARLGRRRASAAARELARVLEGRAQDAPWEVALTLFAFFGEEAGARPPEGLASAEQWRIRWDAVRSAWPEAPELPRLLARLPEHLALGARTQGDMVVAGPQLAEAELLEGVRLALDSAAVARIARPVLAALGVRGACSSCGPDVAALHLMHTRGLDEQHGLVCPGCRSVLRSYWRYGEVEGLEALAPHALRLGLIAEATAQLGGTAIGFQMLPPERKSLTAAGLCRRFVQLYFAPYNVPLPPEALGLRAGATALAPEAPLPDGDLRFTLAPATGTTAEELLELLRVRIERRFRP